MRCKLSRRTTRATAENPFIVHQALPADSAQSAAPGVLNIVPGENWSNYVAKSDDYAVKSVRLRKHHPWFMQCPHVYDDLPDILQRGTSKIRLWRPVMYESPGTAWTLEVVYVTYDPVELHPDEWHWVVETDVTHMKLFLDLLQQVPFGASEAPLLSDELLYAELKSLPDAVDEAGLIGD